VELIVFDSVHDSVTGFRADKIPEIDVTLKVAPQQERSTY